MYLPTWNYEKILQDTIKFCQETQTTHVMLFTDAQHMVWNQLTIEEAVIEANNIAKAVVDLGKHGIKVGINSSYNMLMSRFDHSKHNPQYKHWATLADGTCEKRTPCLLDSALKTYLEEFFKILASANPEYIYIDDDHRYIFAGRNNTWGCMCDLHIEEFSKLTGVSWTREALQKAIYNDKDVQTKWIYFLQQGLEDIAKVIEKAVHSVNKDLTIGVMVPCLHCTNIYNYNLPKMARLFQPEGKLLLRPCIGPYSDRDRRQIIPGLFYMETIAHIMGDTAQYTPEIETTPFTRFSKSCEVIRFHIAQGIINNMYNPAISACGYVGNSPFFEPAIAKMLKQEKPYFEALKKIAPKAGTKKGIGLRFHRESVLASPNLYSNLSDYYLPAFVVHDFLAGSGFCLTYDKANVTFLVGDSVYALSDEELLTYLKGNLICDSVAAKALEDRNLGQYVGAKIAKMDAPFGAEYFSNKEFCGQYTGTYGSLKDTPLSNVQKIIDVNPEAKVLSQLTCHDLKVICPAMTIYENSLGGKVAVMAYRLSPTETDLRHLICYQKQTLMRNILNWMDKASVPAFVEEPSCFAVQYFDDNKNVLVGLANTSYDVASEVIISFTDENLDLANAKYLREDGELCLLKDIALIIDDNKIKITKTLSIFHYFALYIPKKGC
jgi:hypothetical protein